MGGHVDLWDSAKARTSSSHLLCDSARAKTLLSHCVLCCNPLRRAYSIIVFSSTVISRGLATTRPSSRFGIWDLDFQLQSTKSSFK